MATSMYSNIDRLPHANAYQRPLLPHVKGAEGATTYYKARNPTEISGLYLSSMPEDRMLSYQSSQLLVIRVCISALQVGTGCIGVSGPAASSNL